MRVTDGITETAVIKPSQYRLTLNGQEILVGSEYDCWRWLHKRHPDRSVAYATHRMSYRIEPVAS